MPVKAYVLVEAAIGKVAHVLRELQDLPYVVDADVVAGPYDLVVVVEAETPTQVGQFVMEKVHHIEGVNYTMTCVVVTG